MHAELRFHPWQGLAWLARTRVNILHFLGPSSQKSNGKIKATGLSQQPKKPACPERSSTPSPASADAASGPVTKLNTYLPPAERG